MCAECDYAPECYACMVGVATGPESHAPCCPARGIPMPVQDGSFGPEWDEWEAAAADAKRAAMPDNGGAVMDEDPLGGGCGCQYDASGKVFTDHCVCPAAAEEYAPQGYIPAAAHLLVQADLDAARARITELEVELDRLRWENLGLHAITDSALTMLGKGDTPDHPLS